MEVIVVLIVILLVVVLVVVVVVVVVLVVVAVVGGSVLFDGCTHFTHLTEGGSRDNQFLFITFLRG